MKSTAAYALLFLVLFQSAAHATFVYYPLTCQYPPKTYTAVASFSNESMQIGAKTVTVPVVTGMVVSLINISCTWDLRGRPAAPAGTAVPTTISANATQWTLQDTVIYGNGGTLGGGTTYSPVGWSIPLNHKFRVMVTPDPAWFGHVQDGTWPQIF